MARPAAWRHVEPHLRVDQRQAHRVALAQHQPRQTCRSHPCIVEFCHSRAAKRHRTAGVHHQRCLKVCFFPKLLDVVTVAAGERTPVQQAQFIAGTVVAVLGELDAAALVRRAMFARDEALDDPCGDQLQSSDLGDRPGIEQF